MSVLIEDYDRPTKWSTGDPWNQVKHAPGAYPASPMSGAFQEFAERNSIAAAVKARRQDYIRRQNIKIKIGTWNTASVSGTEKDLGGWFVQGLGVQGLSQDLSGLTLGVNADSTEDQIETVEDQELRAKKKKCTLPKGDSAAVASDDDVGLYVLGLQEVVDISSVTEAMRPFYDPNPCKKWKHAIKNALPPGYEKIAEQQLLGLLILVYAAADVAPLITSVDTTSVGTGAMGYVGNKGAVSVRIVLGGTTRFLFVNCHLAAGADQTALTRRIWDTNQILSRTKFAAAELDGEPSLLDHESIGDEDFAFWFGDLNYRLDDIPGEDVRRLLLLHTRNEYDVQNKSKRKIDSELGYIEAPSGRSSTSTRHPDDFDEDHGHPASDSTIEPHLDPNNDPASLITTIKSLLLHDQLYAQQRSRKAFHEGWREGEIGFLPTYKYDVGSVGMFDSGEKKRGPSWCDRILYRTRRDKEQYEQTIKSEIEAKKRDDEMKARGIDQATADHELLFDYDPATDGTDGYDEYDDAQDDIQEHAHDVQHVKTADGFEDVIRLEDYISHQRVLSSDHKPLSAVFNLTYEAVIPELKSRVQQEITRDFDKAENEVRPSVTVVVENSSGGAAHADRPTGTTTAELSAIEFPTVRYDVPETRIITIANTSPMPATFAFINRPANDSKTQNIAPSWLSIEVHHDSEAAPADSDELGQSTRFKLLPGDVATIDITINISEPDFVRSLNDGSGRIDDVLVLRVANGRDHFLSVTGVWLGTSFYHKLDELVRIPNSVRQFYTEINSGSSSFSKINSNAASHHSAPQELFALTEAIPSSCERAIAEWTMLHAGEQAPWTKDATWPFREHETADQQNAVRHQRLGSIREALDCAAPVDEHLDVSTTTLERVELLSETLLAFLQSLHDGVIPGKIWRTIDEKLSAAEKSKQVLEMTEVQQIGMDALSNNPIHRVSFTFLTFMLTRIITELTADTSDSTGPQQPQQPNRRSTVSSRASEALSESSMTSNDSQKSKLSFLPSLTMRRTVTDSVATTSKPVPACLGQEAYIDAYCERLAPILIRADNELATKGKEKKALDLRKQKVLKSFLINGPM